jgi:hypothetical protein
MKHFFGLIILSGNSLFIVTAVNDEIRREREKKEHADIFYDYTKINFLFSFRSFMPTDTNDSSSTSTSMSTVTDNNNNESSIITTNHIQSPPLSSSPQPTTIRSNSPIQTSSKQLDKLRRFLSTLYYFGSDISNEIGERVRTLILALVVSFLLFFDTNKFT